MLQSGSFLLKIINNSLNMICGMACEAANSSLLDGYDMNKSLIDFLTL